jgi:hypothetical protein
MRVEGACRGQENPPVVPDRRSFLRVGAGCALPLLAGGMVTGRGTAEAAEASQRLTERDSTDPVPTHVQRELARTYHAMRGPAGIRGEHVRSLAANLDLLGAWLRSRNDDARADAALRKRIEENGREATAQECLAAYGEIAAEVHLQYGVAPRAGRDMSRAAEALDSVAAQGVFSAVRGHRAALNTLAAIVDRAETVRAAKPTRLMVHQKPGDDFLGYPPGSVLDGLTLCQHLQALQWSLELLAAVLALVTGGAAAGALALAAILLDLLKLVPCKQDVDA